MKTTATRLYLTVLTTVAPATTALAATGTREDTSGLIVWAFLGLCALIVAAQLIPAVLMVVGAAKGVAAGLRERHAVPAEEVARRA
ncbi:MAG: hypothetical protein IH608_02370 [Proteobacteria bacterium]|nr:hypothetical protein [Pseudomonadota bacterium]